MALAVALWAVGALASSSRAELACARCGARYALPEQDGGEGGTAAPRAGPYVFCPLAQCARGGDASPMVVPAAATAAASSGQTVTLSVHQARQTSGSRRQSIIHAQVAAGVFSRVLGGNGRSRGHARMPRHVVSHECKTHHQQSTSEHAMEAARAPGRRISLPVPQRR